MKRLLLATTIIGFLFLLVDDQYIYAQETAQPFVNNSMGFTWATIRVSGEFEYIGNIRIDSTGESRTSGKEVPLIHEHHYFVDKTAVKPHLNRLVAVLLSKPKNPGQSMASTWNLKAPAEGSISQGTTKFGDMEIPYMVLTIKALNTTNKNFLVSKGYAMSFPEPSYYVRQLKIASPSVHAYVSYYEPGVDSNQVLANALKAVLYSKE